MTEQLKQAERALDRMSGYMPRIYKDDIEIVRRALTTSQPAQAGEVPPDWFPGMSDDFRKQAWSIARASLPTQPAPQATPEPVFVIEVRECPDCGHIGINEWHPTDSACSHCDWTGPSPQEDKCPGCGTVGSMSSACPECGHKDTLIAHKHLPIPAATPPQQAAGEPVAWRWMPSHVFPTWVYSDDQNRVADARRFMGDGGVQALYTHPAPGVPDVDTLAQFIRQIDGNHSMGAGALAERICEWLAAAQAKGAAHD